MKKKNKKMSIPFELKNSVISWTRLKTTKLVATAKQLIRDNSCLLFVKTGNFFSQRERIDRLPHSLPVFLFVRFLWTSSLHDERTF